MAAYPDRDPQLMYETAAAQLQHQFDFADTLDSKISNMFGWGTGDLAVLVAILALNPKNVTAVSVGALIASIVFYVFMTGALVVGIFGRKWAAGPNPLELLDAYESSSEQRLRWDVARQLVVAYSENEPAFKLKRNCLRVTTAALFLQTVALLVALAAVA